MNRATRDSLASGTDQKDLTGGNACWQTAPAVFEKLNEDFGPFDIDLTADSANHLCDVWLGPGGVEEDALKADWWSHGANGFSNPPYGKFIRFMLEAAQEWATDGFASTLLLPLRVTRAFRDCILNGAAHLIFPDKRLTFFENGLPRCSYDKRGKVRADPALFDSILVRYLPNRGRRERPTIGEWKVPTHVTREQLDRWVALHPLDAWREEQKQKRAAALLLA